MHKKQKAMFALAKQGCRAKPCKYNDVILRARPQTILRPKDLVTRKLFFARRGAGDVVCTAPT